MPVKGSIARTIYRYKAPPKRTKPLTLEVPTVVKRGKAKTSSPEVVQALKAALDTGTPAEAPAPPPRRAIVTARRPKDRPAAPHVADPDADAAADEFIQRMMTDGRAAYAKARGRR